jgi:hypothetical protein
MSRGQAAGAAASQPAPPLPDRAPFRGGLRTPAGFWLRFLVCVLARGIRWVPEWQICRECLRRTIPGAAPARMIAECVRRRAAGGPRWRGALVA